MADPRVIHPMQELFIDALTYPVRRSGWLMIALGAVFATILDYLSYAPVLGVFGAVISGGYFGAFYLNIVGSTMCGDDEVPNWPSIRSFIDDILWPFFRLVGLLAFSFAPMVLLALFGDDDSPWFSLAVLGSVIFGCLYFPTAVLAMQAFGGLGAALPHIVLPAIFRLMPGYLVALGALVLVFLVCLLAQGLMVKIPYVGWFLTAAVGLYGMMFQGRLIGLIYVEKQQKLGWG